MSDNYSFGIQNFGLSDDSKPLIICVFKNCIATKAIKASRVWIGYFFIYKNKCITKREFLAAVENISSPSYVFDHTYDLDTFFNNLP